MTEKRRIDRGEMSRQALRQAAGDADPDVSRLVDAVPEMLAEAERRRVRQSRVDAISAVVPLARRAIPAMAAATAALVMIATLIGFREPAGTVSDSTDLERLILTGETGGEVSDLLLEAMIDRGDDNG